MRIVSSGKVLNSAEFYKKKRRRRLVLLFLLSFGFASILYFLIYFSRQEQFLITEVTVLGENTVDREEIAGAVKQLLAGHYFRVVPRANVVLFPRRAIKEHLLKSFPRLKSVHLDLDGYQKLLISADERTPTALYCENAAREIGECFFLDEEGFVFALAPSFSDGVYFIYATENPIENPIGERFVSVSEYKFLSEFLVTLEALNLEPVGLEVGESDYRLFLASGAWIIWRRDADPALLYSNLEAFLSDNTIKAQSDFLDRILYLDLRTENKIFYKFKDW